MEWVKLDDCFEFIRNGANIKQFGNDGLPITRIETISDRTVNKDKVGYANIKYPEYSEYYLRYNDILMSHINSEKHLGKVAIYKDEADEIIIHGMNLLCLRSNKNFLADYLYYFFNSIIFKNQINKIMKKSVNQASFNITNLKNLKVPNISLIKQKNIVERLAKVETIIQTRQDQIQAFDDLVESVFDQMFGDVQENNKSLISKKLGDVVKVNQGLQIAKSKRFDKEVENSYKYITIRYLNGNSDTEYIQNPQASVICNKDDILVARTGNTGQIVTGVDGVFHNNFFKVNYDKNQFNKTYLYKYLTNKKIQDKMLMLAGTSTIPDLNHKDFYSIDVLIPPIEKQNHFADFVEKIEKQKQILNDSLGQLTMLFDSLMQDAFDGPLMK